ncbi:MAG: radical SAM protein [Humidesulfovibrio sp.]|uniref:radical SAM protein n=1 Tax=Humidesulfovibrio sp. TaxID=2910988 RepID=UPI0027E79744|nr:radical SAM protein [Humidesulfovibrio sp.]MDQ7834253.1 radical SAM protein [Humidesulfovibrio sp.]
MHRLVVNDPHDLGLALHGEPYRKYRELLNNAFQKKCHGEFPIHIDFDTVDACNLDCPVCADRGRKRNGRKLNVAGACAIIDEGAGKGLYAMNIGAIGEPFMHKEALFAMCEHAKSRGVLDIFVHTNFLLPNHEDIKRLVESGCTVLCLSVDAASPEVYKKTRGGDFNKLMDNVKFLQAYKREHGLIAPVIRVAAVPCSLNHDELSTSFFSFWEGYADVIEIQNYYETLYQPPGLNVSTKRIVADCNTAFWRLLFWPNSAAACCCPLGTEPDLVLTREELGSFSVAELWQGEKIQNIRQHVRNCNWSALPSCNACLSTIYEWESK